MQEQTIYTALGLDELERQGKIDWISFNGDHLQFPDGAFAGLVAKYLSNPRPFRIQMT